MSATKLDAWPALRLWYERQRLAPPAGNLAWGMCRALEMTEPTDVAFGALRRFLADTPDPLAGFLDATQIFADAGADLLNVIADIAAEALRDNRGPEVVRLMRSAADLTGLVGLRFLAAWACLNEGALRECVDECEKVDGAFASVYTLQGQALLELGEAEEAARVLEAAARLGPREVLAWFQLAKACQVTGKTTGAWDALLKCRDLEPDSAEVALFMAMVSLSADATPEMGRIAMAGLKAHLPSLTEREEAQLHLLRLAGKLGDRATAQELAREVKGPAIKADARRMKMVAEVLRTYERLGWMDVSALLLDGLLQ